MVDFKYISVGMDSSQVRSGTKDVDNLGKTGERTERKLTALRAGIAALGAGAVAAATKIVRIQREFDVINASLITVTGSTENAAIAFDAIKDFAASTPYDLAQVSTAFTRLAALGLEPSERALRSYGNTAAAMGKDLIQMIEAVADASTFEFERLKEFGIKARQETDSVSFTFRGVTTTVGKSSEEIQQYLLNIGETDFAGAMAERAATLDGAISNLADSWDNLWLTISQSGVGDYFEQVARGATSLADSLERLIRNNNTTSEEIAALSSEYNSLLVKRANLEGKGIFPASWYGRPEELQATIDRIEEIESLYAELNNQEAPSLASTVPSTGGGTGGSRSSKTKDELDAEIEAWEFYWEEQHRVSMQAQDADIQAWEVYWDEQHRLSEQGVNAEIEAWESYWDSQHDKMDKMSEFAKEAARQTQQALADLLMGTETSFGDTIRRMAAQWASSGLLDFFGNTFSSSGSGGFSGFLSSTFAGFFDSGGRIRSGQFGIAGESGAEFADIGGKGYIIPGPASITSSKDTSGALGRKSINVSITNNNDFSGRGQMDTAQVQQMLEVQRQRTLNDVRDMIYRDRL